MLLKHLDEVAQASQPRRSSEARDAGADDFDMHARDISARKGLPRKPET